MIDDQAETLRTFEPVFGFAIGTLGIVYGSWLIIFTARRHSDWFLLPGAVLLIAGWLTILFADVVTDFAGSVFTSFSPFGA